MSATALSRINSHRAAEQMIHVVIPSPVVSMYYRLSHQFQSSVGGCYSFFFMSICLTGFLPFLIESIMQINVYIYSVE